MLSAVAPLSSLKAATKLQRKLRGRFIKLFTHVTYDSSKNKLERFENNACFAACTLWLDGLAYFGRKGVKYTSQTNSLYHKEFQKVLKPKESKLVCSSDTSTLV